VPADRVSVSHVDKVVDRGYHREVFAMGAFAVYDQAFRWGDRVNGTLALLEWAVADGNDQQVLLGMDAARQGYYRAFGGSPGLSFLLDEFRATMEAHGLGGQIRNRLFVDNPMRAFPVAEVAR
jgi:predicted metal-dependent phosphotriesterase family hydrolase